MKALLILIALLLLLSLTANVRFLLGSRASSSGSPFISHENSYLFVSPLKARADGKDRIRLNVVVLDSQGKGVANQSLTVTTKPTILYEAIQQTTDLYGRATFDFYTGTKGQYEVSAEAAGVAIGEPVTVVFE